MGNSNWPLKFQPLLTHMRTYHKFEVCILLPTPIHLSYTLLLLTNSLFLLPSSTRTPHVSNCPSPYPHILPVPTHPIRSPTSRLPLSRVSTTSPPGAALMPPCRPPPSRLPAGRCPSPRRPPSRGGESHGRGREAGSRRGGAPPRGGVGPHRRCIAAGCEEAELPSPPPRRSRCNEAGLHRREQGLLRAPGRRCLWVRESSSRWRHKWMRAPVGGSYR